MALNLRASPETALPSFEKGNSALWIAKCSLHLPLFPPEKGFFVFKSFAFYGDDDV